MRDQNIIKSNQKGFTLVELLISLVLGALISAAVLQVFITSQRVDGIQRSASEIQTTSIFGMQSIERQIRLANLGNEGAPINDITPNGGIVLTTDDGTNPLSVSGANPFNLIATISGSALNTGYLTAGSGMTIPPVTGTNSWTGATNTNVQSDQLTIQYRNNIDYIAPDPGAPASLTPLTPTNATQLFDCTGTTIGTNETVIERYYLAVATAATATSGASLNLMCEAGRLNAGTITAATPNPIPTITDFGVGGGVVVIDNVDQFNVRLGTVRKFTNPANGTIGLEYFDLSIADYMNIPNTSTKPFIINVKFSILAKSNTNSPESSGNEFTIFGETQTLLPAATKAKNLRRVFETTVLLRNARVFDTKN